jgi:hypothetical protein
MRSRYSWIVSLSLMIGAPALRVQGACQGGSVANFCLPPVSPNEVVGVTEIQTPYSDTIAAYSATELGANVSAYVSAYYDAYVEGYLFQNGTEVAAGYGGQGSVSSGYLAVSTVPYSSYQMQSDHYLIAFFSFFNIDSGDIEYENPEAFTSGSGGGGGDGSGYFEPGGGSPYLLGGTIFLGTTWWTINTAPPQITVIYNAGTAIPATARAGTSGYFEIYGHNFTAEGDDLNPQVSVSGTGVTLQVTYVSDGQVNVSYSVASNASAGARGIRITTFAGTSNVYNMYVGDTTPVITSVTPNVWNAGVTTPFTITGSGFGTNPSLTVIGTGITVYAITGLPSDTRISASVTVDPNALNGPATVTVQSNGYNGLPFQSQQPGQPRQASAVVTLFGEPAPIPRIVDRSAGSTCQSGANIANTTQSVYVGQQIALTGCIDSPPGLLVTGQWSPPQGGTAIGGYTVTDTRGFIVPLPSAAAADYTFYWVDSGNSRQITFNATLLSGNSSPATVTFNVQGPTQPNITTTTSVAQIDPFIQGTEFLHFGSSQQPGITFTGSASMQVRNIGTLSWVQLIKTVESTKITTGGQQTCAPFTFVAAPRVPELDTTYPYQTDGDTSNPGVDYSITTNDIPGICMSDELGEITENFSATMYLMWDPTIPAPCHGSQIGQYVSNAPTCTSIPVPLASVDWRATADAINTLKLQENRTLWTLQCSGPRSDGHCLASAVHVSVLASDPQNVNLTYPVWEQKVSSYVNTMTCH